ncbi:MAG: type II toxin-antitoxin system Phd/YefM family antitoxin [Ilumatobacteraceae bacterium]
MADVPATEISATDASRRFADLLDAVEHRGESFTIVRRGKVVAQLQPSSPVSGASVKRLLRSCRVDAAWGAEVAELRSEQSVQERF